jgi:excisionase family DNA binding protein
MHELKRKSGLDSPAWCAAIVQLRSPRGANAGSLTVQGKTIQHGAREFLTPEQAAEELNTHVQTLRAYVRTGKIPAFGLAGERSTRSRGSDLLQILEPLSQDKITHSKEQRIWRSLL